MTIDKTSSTNLYIWLNVLCFWSKAVKVKMWLHRAFENIRSFWCLRRFNFLHKFQFNCKLKHTVCVYLHYQTQRNTVFRCRHGKHQMRLQRGRKDDLRYHELKHIRKHFCLSHVRFSSAKTTTAMIPHYITTSSNHIFCFHRFDWEMRDESHRCVWH